MNIHITRHQGFGCPSWQIEGFHVGLKTCAEKSTGQVYPRPAPAVQKEHYSLVWGYVFPCWLRQAGVRELRKNCRSGAATSVRPHLEAFQVLPGLALTRRAHDHAYRISAAREWHEGGQGDVLEGRGPSQRRRSPGLVASNHPARYTVASLGQSFLVS